MKGDETLSRISSEMTKKGGEGKRSTPGTTNFNYRISHPTLTGSIVFQRFLSRFPANNWTHLLVLGVRIYFLFMINIQLC